MFDDGVADHAAPSNRASRRSIFARPYICRLTSLSFVICPSTWPFDQGCVIAARTAAMSLRTPVAKDETRLALAFAIQASSLASSFFRIISWNWSMSVRAATRDGTPASMAAMTTRLGHAISLNRHKTGDSSGGGHPLQLLFADRFRPTSTCCPLANRTQRSPEPLRLQATPEFGAVPTATAPLALK